MKEVQYIHLKILKKLNDDAEEARELLGLPRIFYNVEEFNGWNNVFSNVNRGKIFDRSGLVWEKSKIKSSEIEERVNLIVNKYKKRLSPTPQNKRIIKELILFGKITEINDEAWPPFIFQFSRQKNSLSELYFDISKKVKRDNFALNWQKHKNKIIHFQQFLPKSNAKCHFKIKLFKDKQVIRLDVFSNTKLKNIKQNWPIIQKMQEQLIGYTKKDRGRALDKYLTQRKLDEGDQYRVNSNMGKKYKITDKDKAEMLGEPVSSVKKRRWALHKLQKGE